MGVQERLSLSAVSADTLIAAEHVHRYRLAARICKDLRVLDLACGSGYGSAILSETASAVLGLDNDAATVDMAQATLGHDYGIRFETGDAIEFLCHDLAADWDVIVCFEGLEHFKAPKDAIAALARHADAGVRLLISVPNSRAFEERNEFHLTDFGYEEAVVAFKSLGEVTLLYQYHAEGSLIRAEREAEVAGEFVLSGHGEPEYANHFIAAVNLDDEQLVELPDSARMHLAVAPDYNRHMQNLEKANQDLWRENARIARHRLGQADAAAATALMRVQQELRQRDARNAELEGEVKRLTELLTTPRHRFVEQAREQTMVSPRLFGIVRRLWAAVRPK
jgi:SAM-dependent methyltransferase